MMQVPSSVISEVSARIRDTVRVDVRGDFYQLTFRAMSTPVKVSFRAATASLAQEYQSAVVQWTASFEARYSRFIPQSIVGQINAAAGGGWVDVDEETGRLFSLCSEMFSLTRGAFDAAALPMIRLWDWKANPPRVPEAKAVAAAREISGWHKIERSGGKIRLPKAGMGIDLGGIGKEYAVDQVFQMGRERGLTDLLIDIGQDVRVFGRSPGKDAWYIGLEEPETPGRCWAGVALTDHAVATSGDYFRNFMKDGRRYGHIVDPRTGEPVCNGCQAVTVIAPTCLIAGILSTAAFILGPDEGLELVQQHGKAEACITTDRARYQTRRFSSHVVG
jgi:FAD:protein FMN transferase